MEEKMKYSTRQQKIILECLQEYGDTFYTIDQFMELLRGKEIRIGNFSGSVKGFQADCYVRMSLSYSNDDIGRGVKLTGLDTANWVYNSQDGYYYYRKKISEGEKTAPLCTGFQIDPQKIDDTYRDSIKDFEINVYEEAVQAEGFSDYESAWRYFSDPVSAQAERRGNA